MDKMHKEEAVQIMCDAVDEFNRYQASAQGMSLDKVEEFIVNGRSQLEYVNGIIYDTLKTNGVII